MYLLNEETETETVGAAWGVEPCQSPACSVSRELSVANALGGRGGRGRIWRSEWESRQGLGRLAPPSHAKGETRGKSSKAFTRQVV